MGWKTRKGRRYYYRSAREGDRTRSEYVGPGVVGQMAELLDRADREEQGRAAEAWRQEKARLDAEDLEQAGRFRWVESVVRLAIEAAGFVRHNRGEWRRTRMGKAKPTDARPKMPAPRAEIEDVVKRVMSGDQTAAPRLRELIALDPDRMIKVAGGDLADQVERHQVAKLAKSTPIWAESLPPKLDALRAELGGPDPSPIERLLVERCVACWLDLHALEVRSVWATGETFRQAEHRERVRDRAHRRYLSALKSLAVVRKLGVMVVLASVDARTVNVDARSS